MYPPLGVRGLTSDINSSPIAIGSVNVMHKGPDALFLSMTYIRENP